ncbi:MAG: 23S rRNA (adenine(2503)-C(2))-methyltransferase RlmN [Candidatus Omnitrophica bacterium]|nr:23S rRNA (adenine(2503)-C(2))-methyltransferase RlmN [Candidatus Omnitrophota bacterium]
MAKGDIRDFTLEELNREMIEIGEPSYRSRQISLSLYQKGGSSFEDISGIPKNLKEKLAERYYISFPELSEHLKSSEDGTEKFLFKLADGNFIETVLIKNRNRKTICLSTQVGCRFKCQFCASGKKGFVRDLSPSEIVNQVIFLQHNLKHKITNYVFMGMGEPLDNYKNVSKAIMIINSQEGLNIGARRITVSTCGIIPGIEKLKDLGLQVNLSVSLHATSNKLRNELVPINRKYPLEELIASCQNYKAALGRMITFEYVLIKDKNDSLLEAQRLAVIAKRLKAKVNLIECSPVFDTEYKPPAKREINEFMKRLVGMGVKVTLRESKGKDIKAACGQLAGISNL